MRPAGFPTSRSVQDANQEPEHSGNPNKSRDAMTFASVNKKAKRERDKKDSGRVGFKTRSVNQLIDTHFGEEPNNDRTDHCNESVYAEVDESRQRLIWCKSSLVHFVSLNDKG